AYLARHGAAGAFIGYYATFAPGHTLKGAIPHLRQTIFFVFMFAPLLLLLITFWYLVAAWRGRWTLENRDWIMVAAALTTLAYYPKFLSRADWHVLGAGSPAFPLLFYAAYKLGSVLHRPRAVTFAVAGLMLAAVVLL